MKYSSKCFVFIRFLELSNRSEQVILPIIRFLLVGSFYNSLSGYTHIYILFVCLFTFNVQSFLPYPSNFNTMTQNIQIMFSCNYGSILDFSFFT